MLVLPRKFSCSFAAVGVVCQNIPGLISKTTSARLYVIQKVVKLKPDVTAVDAFPKASILGQNCLAKPADIHAETDPPDWWKAHSTDLPHCRVWQPFLRALSFVPRPHPQRKGEALLALCCHQKFLLALWVAMDSACDVTIHSEQTKATYFTCMCHHCTIN